MTAQPPPSMRVRWDLISRIGHRLSATEAQLLGELVVEIGIAVEDGRQPNTAEIKEVYRRLIDAAEAGGQ